MKHIDRPDYLNRLIDLMNTPDIKTITGIRRSGKSELMRSYVNYISTVDENANVIYVDYFDLDYDELKNYRALNNYEKANIKQLKTIICLWMKFSFAKNLNLLSTAFITAVIMIFILQDPTLSC